MLESTIQARIMKGLKDAGIYAHKNITSNRKGIPDIMCCVHGKYLALEVKNETGKPTDLQLWNINEIRNSGGRAEIVRSWKEVEDILRSMHE